MKKSIFMLGMALTACLISCTDDDLGNGTVKNPVQTGDEILFGSTLSGDTEVIESKVESRTVYGDRTSMVYLCIGKRTVLTQLPFSVYRLHSRLIIW